nr:MAG TPA: hypothetical protein [Caudoviricetes sp.]
MPSQRAVRRCRSCLQLPQGATATTAASGGSREELLGQRTAGCEQSEADAGSRNP